MKKIILLSLFLVACQTNQTRPVITPDELPPAEELETSESSTVELALVAMNDGVTTPPSDAFGCGDTIVYVEREVSELTTVTGTIETALEELFSIDESLYGESGLYNSLAPSDVMVDSVMVTGTSIEISLSGSMISAGSCDDPRLEEQIRATAAANAPEGATITILFDGEDLHEYFNMSGL